MAFQTGRIQIDGSLNVDGSIYQFNELFTPGGTGGGGDVAWASGNVGSNNQLITANGDGSIVAESKLTFDGNRLDIDASLRVGLTGDYWLEVNVANGGFPVTKIGDLGETGNGGWLEIDGGWGDITWWAELTDARWGWEYATEALWTNVNNDVSVGKDLRVGKVTTLDGSVFFRGIIEVSTGYTLYYNPTTDEVTYDEVSPGGGGGISWSGSTANGIATYGSSSTVVSEPNLTFDGSILEFDSSTNKTIRMKDMTVFDLTPQSLEIIGSKGAGQGITRTSLSIQYGHAGDGGDIKITGGPGANADPVSLTSLYYDGGDGGDVIIAGGTAGTGYQVLLAGNVNISGGVINLNSNAVDIPLRLRHTGDTDTYIEFGTDIIEFYAGSATLEKMLINSTGIVINEHGANYDFRVESDTKTHMLFVDANLDVVGINNSSPSGSYELHVGGTIAATGDIIAYASDIRLKTNIQKIENPLDKILSLEGFTYKFNDKALELNPEWDDDYQVGLSAQDLQKVLPEAVKPAPFDAGPNGESVSGEDYLTIQYEKLVPLLLEGIKEQQEIINSQQKQIDDLKEKVDFLMKHLS